MSPAAPMGSVKSTLRVLEEVAHRQPIGVSELSRVTGIPKTTVQRCLVTLHECGWLHVIDDDASYTSWGVTSKPLALGLAAAGQSDLRTIASPHLEKLRDQTGETVHLVIREGFELLILLRWDSPKPVRTFVEVGTRSPMHATASGIAILAAMSDAEVESFMIREHEKFTDTTIVDKDALLAELDRTRRRGYAVNATGWWRLEVCAVGAAITTAAGDPIAALTMSVPSSRFDPSLVATHGQLAIETAQSISTRLQ